MIAERWTARLLAGAALAVVALLVVWAAGSDQEPVIAAALVEDLNEFAPPSGATAAPIEVTRCTANGYSPVYAERRFLIEGTADEAVEDLRSQALRSGWTESHDADEVGVLARDGRVLYLDPDYPMGEKTVILHAEWRSPIGIAAGANCQA